jgi:hypothetical protein
MIPIGMIEVAEIVLRAHGLEIERFTSSEAARRSDLLREKNPRRWPCYFDESSTSGEKPLEELVGPAEQVDTTRFRTIDVVTLSAPAEDADRLADARARLMRLRDSGSWHKDEIVDIVRTAVPELDYVDRGSSLDERM